ncbi:MAG: phosphate ABC transporter substrate-binding/OmpA family protein [Pseudomonadota bacterium]
MGYLKHSSAVLALMAGIYGTAQAGEVTLIAKDGSTAITGEFMAYEEGVFTLKTRFGVMRIDGDKTDCNGGDCPAAVSQSDVSIAGSETVGEALMPLLLEGFAGTQNGLVELGQNGGIGPMLASLTADSGYGDPIGTFAVSSTSSADAFDALLERGAEIGMSSRRITPQEARALRRDGGGNMIDVKQERVVAVDSIVVVVHPSNPVQRISLENLDRIYSGGVTNWAQLGGTDAPIRVIGRSDDSGTGRTFEERVFAESGRTRAATVEVASSNEEVAAAVANDPNAVGYVGHAYKRGNKALALAGNCNITSFPDAFSAKTEEYPLQRRLYLYSRADTLSPTGEALLEFAASDEADNVVAKAGFIDLGIDRIVQDDPGGRMRDLIQNTVDPYEFSLMRELLVEMLQYDRLSTTFRFASGSSQLDGKGLLDLERLVEFLEAQPKGTKIALVGFTDADGAFDANQQLSLVRARQVAATIDELMGARVAHVDFEARGFGEFSPTACNDTLDGKRINRRVEVWIGKQG